MKPKILIAVAAIAVAFSWQAEAQTYDTNNVVVQTFAGSGFSGYVDGQLKAALTAGNGESAPREVAKALGMEEGAVRVAVHRLRKRYRQLLRDEITNTLSDPAMVDEELRTLFGAFSG